ncbi:hypothetical protein [Vibrio sp. Isolate24]|nr:hypothetical protein [Vibrio sp. Isolate24]MCG9680929.1 hypothetical protein [Vibrio sp. Isolate24]
MSIPNNQLKTDNLLLLFSFGGNCGAVGFGVSWLSPIAPTSKGIQNEHT